MAVGNEVGYKMWDFAEPYGYVVQFEPYQGVKRRKLVASSTKWGLREYFVLRLIECLPPIVSYQKFMGNYFTYFHLLADLAVNNT